MMPSSLRSALESSTTTTTVDNNDTTTMQMNSQLHEIITAQAAAAQHQQQQQPSAAGGAGTAAASTPMASAATGDTAGGGSSCCGGGCNSNNETESQWQQLRLKCGELVNHTHTQFLIVALIAVNALMMGISTFSFVKDDPGNSRAFDITDNLFLVIFTVELAMQFVFRGWKLITDGWLVFDLIVIVTSWGFSELQIIRAFRIFRALRLITRIQVMQNLVVGAFIAKTKTANLFLYATHLDLLPSCRANVFCLCLCAFYIVAVPNSQLSIFLGF
jgi:Ion transport protein